MCVMHKPILEHVTFYPYCLISLHHLHVHVFQVSSLQYLEKLEILLVIIVNLRKISTTTHRNKFVIPIQIPIHKFCNLEVSEMIYKDHHIQITNNLLLPMLCWSLVYDMHFYNLEILQMTYHDHHSAVTHDILFSSLAVPLSLLPSGESGITTKHIKTTIES